MSNEKNKCPRCGEEKGQHKHGMTPYGTQRIRCWSCKKQYTVNPKIRGCSEEVQHKAMQLMVDGMSGRAIGRQLGMSKANAYNWAKKTRTVWISPDTDLAAFECDEVYWFLNGRKDSENGINRYIMTTTSRNPRQIVGFAVNKSVNKESLQQIADGAPVAENYYTDGCPVYCDVVYGGRHRRNVNDKKDTHNVESTNSDLRHFLAGLARRNRCFYRSDETLLAVLSVFVNAYNKYGDYKAKNRMPVRHRSPNPAKHLHKYKELPKSLIDFV
jgi:transposase-like protein/IS1 family transposase